MKKLSELMEEDLQRFYCYGSWSYKNCHCPVKAHVPGAIGSVGSVASGNSSNLYPGFSVNAYDGMCFDEFGDNIDEEPGIISGTKALQIVQEVEAEIEKL
jgi:hypothetical protein